MSLRILGGRFKGQSLKSPPPGPLSKPTTSLARKAVFDISQDLIKGAYFLDLFACSGAMGIEALSRGASQATFVEKDRKTAQILEENVKKLGIKEQTKILCQDVFKAILSLDGSYQVIYLDPPYALIKDSSDQFMNLLHTIDKSPLLKAPGILFIEEGTPKTLSLEEEPFTKLSYKNTRRLSAATLHQLVF